MQHEDDRKRGGGWIIAALLAMPVCYILSVGPAIWLYPRLPPPVQSCIQVVYAPLGFVARTPAGRPLDAYARFWRDL